MTDEEQILIGLRGKRIDIAECLFRHGPQNVTKLAEICDMEESQLSHHLQAMRKAGILVTSWDNNRRQRTRNYSLTNAREFSYFLDSLLRLRAKE